MPRSPRLHLLLGLWSLFWVGLLLGTTTPGWAEPANSASASSLSTEAPPLADVSSLRAQLDKLPTVAQNVDDPQALRAQIEALSTEANRVITARTTQLNDLNARLGELGEEPAAGITEDPDVTRQRNALLRERNGVDADIRLARLVVVDAQQRVTELVNRRRQYLEAQISERAASPLGRRFWRELAQAWPEDRARLRALTHEWKETARQAWDGPQRLPVLVTSVIALLLLTLGNALAERALVRLATRILPGRRLRRSLLIITIVTANMLLVTLALRLTLGTLDEQKLLGPLSQELTNIAKGMLLFVAFVVSLGRALLANGRSSWRLPPIPEDMAQRLRHFPALAAVAMALVWLPSQINPLIGASAASANASYAFTALLLTALVALLLSQLRGPRAGTPSVEPATVAAPHPDNLAETTHGEALSDAHPPEDQRPMWVVLSLGTVAFVLIVVVALVGMGYLALAALVAGQLVWTGIVAATFYVLFKFADDLFMALLSAKSGLGPRLQQGFGFAPSTLNQSAVVLSALARLALFFYMLIALVAPLGTDPGEVFQRSGQLGDGLQIGEFRFVPSAIAGALGVVIAGFIALRVGRHWMQTRYLPTTTLEPGMQSSITTLLGYVGGVLVVALALSALGIGINRIAWIASALSVGIGFGLQAIVQNFISGLILLAERPVKVGDWVVLGTTEGDVRRINVRATEIQLGDRSTVIVPNSEFITKTVRNMTLTNAEGRVLIRLPMPLNTDARQVRDIMLSACQQHPGVLKTPAPSLTLEGVENSQLIFQSICYVSGPRQVGSVRSDLLFSMLDGLREAQLPMAAPTLIMDAGASPARPAASGAAATPLPPTA